MGVETGLSQFALDLQQQVISRAEMEEEGSFREGAFTQIMIEHLGDAGELEDAQTCLHRAYGLQLSGWALSENEENLDLLVTIHTDEVPPRTIARDEMTAAFKRLMNFLQKALKGYHFNVEESTSVFDVAQRIHEVKNTVVRVRFILLTDGILNAAPPKDQDLPGVRASYHVWDIERLYRCVSSGREREAIEIDFEAAVGSPIPCLMQPASNSEYAAYLAIFPAQALVELYGRYGSRLLERNVRSFLQARGKINAGMRRTIREEPHMFLAYNNGLSTTAEAVELVDLPSGGKGIKGVRDFQIVNGGQTTASIYHAVKKDRADVSQLFVQAKLTVLNDLTKMDEVIPRISEYANSQNKVQAADLAANDKYHRRIEELSRTIWAPAKDGVQRQTRWYYERARGQFQDDLAREGTEARQRDFLATHPKTQLFGKTDLAKCAYTWEKLPHIVSRGAQFCFSHFTTQLEAHIKGEGAVDQAYFERLVAKVILFRSAERLIAERFMRPNGYTGYRANLVTYTLARISHDTRGKIDLGQIWRAQAPSQALEDAIIAYCGYVWEHITRAPGNGNVTQYCKKEDCWISFLAKEIPLPRPLYEEIAGPSPGAVVLPEAVKDLQSPDPKRENIIKVMAVPPDVWFDVAAWARDNGHLNELQRTFVCDIAVQVGYGKEPSARKAEEAISVLESARRLGFHR
jgi:hypothetical protein